MLKICKRPGLCLGLAMLLAPALTQGAVASAENPKATGKAAAEKSAVTAYVSVTNVAVTVRDAIGKVTDAKTRNALNALLAYVEATTALEVGGMRGVVETKKRDRAEEAVSEVREAQK